MRACGTQSGRPTRLVATRRPLRHRSAGFSLLELLVVIAVSAVLIVLLNQIYRVVARSTTGVGSVAQAWSSEQFMRRQYLLQHAATTHFNLFEGRAGTLRFVSNKSARHGEHGAPVIVRYHFDVERNRLVVYERDLPPWWDDAAALRIARAANDEQGWWQDTVLIGVAAARFSYRTTGVAQEEWQTQWDTPGTAAPLVRIELSHSGHERVIVLEAAALSFSTPSGF